MKLAALLLTALVSLAGVASADEYGPQSGPSDPYGEQPPRAERQMRRQGPGMGQGQRGGKLRKMRRIRRIRKLIRKYDLNHDGVVDQGEMPPRLAQRMQRLDRNHDGWLDAADLQPRRGR
jgi:hypothetical protein